MGLAGIRPGRHAYQPQLLHQALHPLAVDGVPTATGVFRHAPRTIKRMPGVLCIEQLQQQAVKFVPFFLLALVLSIDNRARHGKQLALPGYRQHFAQAYPSLPLDYRLIPDFF